MNYLSFEWGKSLRLHFGVAACFIQAHFEALADRLTSQAKHQARLLSKAIPDVTHQQALEAVAVASGYDSWHVMGKAIDQIAAHHELTFYPASVAIHVLLAGESDELSEAATGARAAYCEHLGELVDLAPEEVKGILFKNTQRIYLEDCPPKLRAMQPSYVLSLDSIGKTMLMKTDAGLWRSKQIDKWLKSAESATEGRRYLLLSKAADLARSGGGHECLFKVGEYYAQIHEQRLAVPFLQAATDSARRLFDQGPPRLICDLSEGSSYYLRAAYTLVDSLIVLGETSDAIQVCQRHPEHHGLIGLAFKTLLPCLLAAEGRREEALAAMESAKDHMQLLRQSYIEGLTLCRLGDWRQGAIPLTVACIISNFLVRIGRDPGLPRMHSLAYWAVTGRKQSPSARFIMEVGITIDALGASQTTPDAFWLKGKGKGMGMGTYKDYLEHTAAKIVDEHIENWLYEAETHLDSRYQLPV